MLRTFRTWIVRKPSYAVAMTKTKAPGELTIRPLTPETWDAFADLAQRHNGVWGGCWCTWFHRETHSAPETNAVPKPPTYSRDYKRERVETGRAHASLMFDGETAVGWAEYGNPEELPGIYHLKEYLEGLDVLPDYRITCFFIDTRYRRQGVSAVALSGALDLIALAGGGVVEAYPRDTGGKQMTASFLYNGTRSLFEQAGFSYSRPKGKFNCVMTATVAPAK